MTQSYNPFLSTASYLLSVAFQKLIPGIGKDILDILVVLVVLAVPAWWSCINCTSMQGHKGLALHNKHNMHILVCTCNSLHLNMRCKKIAMRHISRVALVYCLLSLRLFQLVLECNHPKPIEGGRGNSTLSEFVWLARHVYGNSCNKNVTPHD